MAKKVKNSGKTGSPKNGKPSKMTSATLALNQIVMPPKHLIARSENGDISTLTSLIKSQGILSSLVVRPASGGKYQLLCGHRRFAAARKAGLKEVPVTIRTDLDDNKDALSVIMSENSPEGRTNLSVTDQVRMYEAMSKECGKKDGDHNYSAIARMAGVGSETVRRVLRTTELPKTFRERLDTGEMAVDTADKFLRISDPKVRKHVEKAVEAGEITTARELQEAQAEFINEMKDKGREVEAPKDKRRQGGRGSASVTVWRGKKDIQILLDSLLVACIEAKDGVDSNGTTFYRAQIAVIFYMMGLTATSAIDKKDFKHMFAEHIDRVKVEQSDSVEDEDGEDEDEDEKPAKKGKKSSKKKAKVTAGGGEDDADDESEDGSGDDDADSEEVDEDEDSGDEE